VSRLDDAQSANYVAGVRGWRIDNTLGDRIPVRRRHPIRRIVNWLHYWLSELMLVAAVLAFAGGMLILYAMP
jgi:hypothetical protein